MSEIPIICQGEIISEENVQYIKRLKITGLDVQGIANADVNYIRLIDEHKRYFMVPTS